MWLHVPSDHSPSAQASAASTSASIEPPRISVLRFSRSAWWRGKPLLPVARRRLWTVSPFLRALSGLISQPSMLERGAAEWISSLAASPASPSPSPGLGEDKTTSDGCGLSSRKLLLILDRPSCSWRTSQGSDTKASETFSGPWPRSGSMRSGRVFEPQTSEARTSESGGSAWLTPHGFCGTEEATGRQGGGGEFAKQATMWPTGRASMGKGSYQTEGNGDGRLEVVAERLWQTPKASGEPESAASRAARGSGGQDLESSAREWPTPCASLNAMRTHAPVPSDGDGAPRTLSAATESWPTPTAGDSKASGGRSGTQAHQGTSLTDAAVREPRWDGQPHFLPVLRIPQPGPPSSPPAPTLLRLNPRFVEWLMGFPCGWTDCALWGTRWSPPRPPQLSLNFGDE